MDKFTIFKNFLEQFLSYIYYDALRDFVPFVPFKKREKHSLLLVKPVTLLKQTLLHRCFSRF